MKMQLLVLGCLVALATGIEVQKLLREESGLSSSSDTMDVGTGKRWDPLPGHQCHRGQCWNCDKQCYSDGTVCRKNDENCDRVFCCKSYETKCFQNEQCIKVARSRCHMGRCWNCDPKCFSEGFPCDDEDDNCKDRYCCEQTTKECTDNYQCFSTATDDDDDSDD